MNDTIRQQLTRIREYWNSRTKKQKWIGIGAFLLFVIAISTIVLLMTREKMVPLYSELAPTEIGAIKENLDGRGIKYEITEGGTGILVPEETVDSLKVDLAAEGLPKSGSIDYGFFSENAGFGMTDNEFNILKLDAMQTELAHLITGIEGVKDAKVMVNLPEKDVFVREDGEKASASVVLKTEPGYQFDQKQIKALYHLVSKSVPNLPAENIVIMNQNFEYYDQQDSGDSVFGNEMVQQMEVKKKIERDIQRQVQSMLGTLMGQDKVVASVTADIDFTQENREENLVTPVDEEKMAGIQISAQRITETFTGDGAPAGGIPQGEDPADAQGSTYMEGAGGSGDYERSEETINNEVNRIRKKITESPYKIRDLGIQVMVEPPKANNADSLPQERVDDIQQMLGTIVRTSIDKGYNQELTDQDLEEKISVSVQPFKGKATFAEEKQPFVPWWVYVIGAVLLVIIGVLVFLILRAKRQEEEEEFEEDIEPAEPLADINEIETEGSARRKQLEKMAKEKPEEFAKLLRSWLSED
ncbi:flagellar basal-body MS-ring/collar protein FliF [Pseudobacillus badius]|uniref:flagellar basal-body MS-ring/collar protein FliF n=1 Tax=Bacillus badius TaxID=1455 RepID=UPI0007B09BFA|nr:flagellar basal-body MS-ring/collar protein FliF [Bacillus badius]KZO01661.1 flagellar M-ring protein FliF [Bacillus badius]OCS90056.1 flagellar M-ring protein FliF [Bacillus badius]OVE53584.1 flagellar M-ring protein FliF [Bacillus badius]TDW05951.1 flagellar M-ring protein FliF [Bacillus badius]